MNLAVPLVEFQVLPLGTCSPSVSEYVAKAVDVIRKLGFKYRVTPMGTVVKVSDLTEVGEIMKRISEVMKESGVQRVVIVVRADVRFDKDLDMDKKVESVMRRLGER